MIDLFEEPYRISISQPSVAGGSRTGLLLGLIKEDKELLGIVLGEDGAITQLHASYFTIDFRYDAETDRWMDSTDREPTQPDQVG